ncbi:type IV secretory system conjugative DNA transfer family protein [Vibrio cholerae]|nr:type IV secretory system conjugative DNA transfer family protein [Vibrio cholerae]MVC24493.1 type IV secretory system conjugative DNA transfer family protein [Vibrio cholerae]MVC65264.1 type IV secretory system conjugative DNA transfer family protein [Vibrio cholerae]MVC87363.1 type IV secretory system conjugative DNA transfer family protein [Vibrio cholerae]HDG1511705.1 type IV secretory system conjugative DNA transfer family protein [Vibrio cholerae]
MDNKFIKPVLLGLIIGLLTTNAILVFWLGGKQSHLIFTAAFIVAKDIAQFWILYVIGFGFGLVITVIGLLAEYGFFKKKKLYGVARFAKSSDFKKFSSNVLAEEGIIIGKYKGQYVRSNDPLSILVPAPQGTGKTAGFIIPSLFSFTGSAIINDVKGELWNITSFQRSHFSTVRLFAPTLGLDNEATVSWNPLHEKCIPSEKTWNPFLVDVMPIAEKDKAGFIKNTLESIFKHDESAAKTIIQDVVMFFDKQQKDLFTADFLAAVSSNDSFDSFCADLHILCECQDFSIIPSCEWDEFQGLVTQRFFDFFLAKKIDYVEKIAGVLFPTLGLQGNEKHFMSEAKILFSFFAIALVHVEGSASIPRVYDAALSGSDMHEVIATIMDEADLDYVTNLGNGLLQKGGDEFGSVKSTFRQGLDSFVNPIMRKSMEECDFTWSDFRQKTAFSLYIYIPPAEMEKCAPVIRMLTEYLVGEFLSHPWQKEKQPHQVVFFEDEFPRIGRMECIKNMPTLSRSFGVKAMFVFQNSAQMISLYGQEGFEEMISNTDFKTILQQNSEKTAETLSKLVGDETREKISESKSKLLAKADGNRSVSQEGHKLITPQYLLNLDKNKVVVLLKGHHATPILADIPWWFKDKNMKHLAGSAYGLNLEQHYS